MMGEVLPFPAKPLVNSPWRLVTIGVTRTGLFEVCVWTGAPGDPGVQRMFGGGRGSQIEAAALAHTKAVQLGIHEIVDFTDATDPDDVT